MRVATLPLALAALTFAAPAYADATEQAEACVRTKVYSAYEDGWSLRTLQSTTRDRDDHKIWPTTLVAGLTYRVIACGQEGVTDVELVLYDGDGKLIEADASTARDASLELKVASTGGFYIAAKTAGGEGDGPTAIAVGVIYK